VRNKSNTGKSTRQGNLRHPWLRLQSFSNSASLVKRTIEILPSGVGDFPILYSLRCYILYICGVNIWRLYKCNFLVDIYFGGFCLHSIERFPAIYFSLAEVNIRFIHMQPYLGSISYVFHHKVQCI
jgi:hypothetical protein